MLLHKSHRQPINGRHRGGAGAGVHHNAKSEIGLGDDNGSAEDVLPTREPGKPMASHDAVGHAERESRMAEVEVLKHFRGKGVALSLKPPKCSWVYLA